MYKIVIVGEAWGEHEERQRMPFVGPAGYELNKMLEEADIRKTDCYLTNVFNLNPGGNNDVENLCGPKAGGIVGREPLRSGKYVRAEYLGEVQRLEAELASIRPNLILCLGGAAAWATLGSATISKVRGTVATGIHGLKVLATYHPQAVLRDWSLRPVTVLDLMKAKRESEFPEVRRPNREIWIEPSLEDIERFYHGHVASASRLSVDIETAGDQITCIGFAPNPNLALVVPFTQSRGLSGSYWSTVAEEERAWWWVAKILAGPQEKVFQNGLYDLHFLWRRYGIAVNNCEHDTMLLHHALHPESPKGLDFLGSVYTNEASWKLMRKRGKTTIKKDE